MIVVTSKSEKPVDRIVVLISINVEGETWWDESHDWSVATDGYRLFRRDR